MFNLLLEGLERKSFDNKHVTFEEHVTTEHNMWHYLYFTVLVKVKDPTEFTGPESYVHEMVKVNNLLSYYFFDTSSYYTVSVVEDYSFIS